MTKRTKGTHFELFNRLRDLLGPKKVSRSVLDQISYSRDMWPLAQLWMRKGEVKHIPDFIVWPETSDEVSRLIRLCNEIKFPLIPFGAGSGLCGATLPLNGGIICDMKRMNQIESINEKSLLVTAQTGVIGEHLERRLHHLGYTLGHFPGSIYSSTLGGYLAGRSAGMLSTKYGKIEDMVVSMEAVLPNGEIVHTRTTPRSATGPDFNQLLMGTEGTLGIITRATLKIHPSADARVYQSFLFPTLESGCEAMRKVLQSGLIPAAIRLDDFEMTNQSLPVSKRKGTKDGCLLIILFEGWTRRCDLESHIAQEICLLQGGQEQGPDPAKNWWDNRYAPHYAQSVLFAKEGTVLDTVGVATTWTNLMNLYQSVKGALAPYMDVTATFAHAYRDGCSINFSIQGKAGDLSDTEVYQNAWAKALDACIDGGGTLSHHHGIGILKSEWMQRQLGPWMKIYAGLKQKLDPNQILNPHKMGLP
jgi:alkyldihydroxyacetonephosphate synthase